MSQQFFAVISVLLIPVLVLLSLAGHRRLNHYAFGCIYDDFLKKERFDPADYLSGGSHWVPNCQICGKYYSLTDKLVPYGLRQWRINRPPRRNVIIRTLAKSKYRDWGSEVNDGSPRPGWELK